MTNPIYQTVIVGGGFAGLFTALHLSYQHYPRTIILIDQHDRFCFKPLLYEYLSGEMDANQVVPSYAELLHRSGVIFVQDTVQAIDLHQRQIHLVSGDSYGYSNLVLTLGSVTGYFDVEGAQEYAFSFRTQADAIALAHHLRDCLQRAIQLNDPEQRRQLLTLAVIGGGPSGVEMAATLADLIPQWYIEMGGNQSEVRIVLVNHGKLLEGDINSQLRETVEKELQKRTVPVELLLGVAVTAIHPNMIEYKRDDQTSNLAVGTVIWTTGTNTHPLIKSLPIPDEHRDKHGQLKVTPTLQLPDFPEVFAGGDCTVNLQPSSDTQKSAEAQPPKAIPLPPTAQVAYQQGYAIASNLQSLALGDELKTAEVNLRGTLLKLGLENGVANIFNTVELTGEVGHLIRQGTYLELLPTPVHDFKATSKWLKDELFEQRSPKSMLKNLALGFFLFAVGFVGITLLISHTSKDQIQLKSSPSQTSKGKDRLLPD
ncbi:NAD(P)/FAD-dependent oxidoreductase (plasmid) [Pseudanabaena biceps]|nr:NAD(P)/FAD-dependent oxidoreductase [Pseudanabaena biceps]